MNNNNTPLYKLPYDQLMSICRENIQRYVNIDSYTLGRCCAGQKRSKYKI